MPARFPVGAAGLIVQCSILDLARLRWRVPPFRKTSKSLKKCGLDFGRAAMEVSRVDRRVAKR